MSAVPADTSPEAWDLQTEIYRRMTGAERVAVTYRLNEMARGTGRAGIHARHPAYSDEELKRALFRIMHGDALTHAVWPDQPLLDP